MKIEIEDHELNKLLEAIKSLTEEISKLRLQPPIYSIVSQPYIYPYPIPGYIPQPYISPTVCGLSTSNTYG